MKSDFVDNFDGKGKNRHIEGRGKITEITRAQLLNLGLYDQRWETHESELIEREKRGGGRSCNRSADQLSLTVRYRGSTKALTEASYEAKPGYSGRVQVKVSCEFRVSVRG